MESAGVAAAAAAAAAPFVVLRVIADGPDDALPAGVEAWIDERGERRLAPLLEAVSRPSAGAHFAPSAGATGVRGARSRRWPSASRRKASCSRTTRSPPRGLSAVTAMIGVKLVQWVRWVLRFRGLVVVLAVLATLFGLRYSATHLGINTDTANMISAKLPWRRDFIDYRASFPARDRNIVIVVEADTAGRADAFAAALVERLRQNPRLFKSVFSAGVGEFFERNGLLYLSVDGLEKLSDRLAEAQPLIGRLRPAFDGAAVVDLAGEAIVGGGAAGDAAASALYARACGRVRRGEAGRADPIAWRAARRRRRVRHAALDSAAAEARFHAGDAGG